MKIFEFFTFLWILSFSKEFKDHRILSDFQMGKPGSKQGQAEASEQESSSAQKKEKKGPMHLSKGAKKAKNIKANHGGKTDRKPL